MTASLVVFDTGTVMKVPVIENREFNRHSFLVEVGDQIPCSQRATCDSIVKVNGLVFVLDGKNLGYFLEAKTINS